jgi:ABC-type transport system substrate-binding protein
MTRSRSRRRSAILLLLAATLIGTACGQPSLPSASAPPPSSQSAPPVQSTGPFEPMAWPAAGDAPCDQAAAPDAAHAAYTGLIRRIRAVDATTVEFVTCTPDIDFPARLAFAAFAINDTGWLESHIDPNRSDDQAIVGEVNGTGPYRLEAWNRGSDISLVRNEAYWGEAARTERILVRWRDDAAARLAELRDASVDGIDGVDADGLAAVEGDVEMQAVARPGLNVFYVGFNNTFAPFDDVKVRQAIAMGIDRDRIVQALYPPGSEVASHFSPCVIPDGCTGDPWYEFDPSAARQLLADAGFPDGFKTTIQFRDVARPYLLEPTGVAVEIQAQLLANLGIEAELEVMPDETFLTTVDDGQADGIHLLGRTASVPAIASLLEPHFGAIATKEFGLPIEGLVDALAAGASTVDAATRTSAYTDANTAIRANVPMIPIAHAGSMTAYRADVVGAQASPLWYERFAAMTPGDRRQLVWVASAEPEGLYCADETSEVAQLVCSQVSEALYSFEPGGAAPVPSLAESCEPNPELTTWTCTLRAGVTFHDGASLDANDVVLSFAAQWDAEHPLHRGRDGRFDPFLDTFGGFLNPPAAVGQPT